MANGNLPMRRSLRIIVADDDPDTVRTLRELLTDEGHEVVGVHSGHAAVSQLRRQSSDAVIVDINMPGVSGYEVGRETKRIYGELSPLLIAISGKWTGQTDRMLSELAGFSHFFEKPCRLASLLAVLEPLRNQPPPSPPPFIDQTVERLK